MGMFDTVHCEYPLPDARHQGLEFQTTNLECLMDEYTLTGDGRLVRRAGIGFGGEGLDHDTEWPLHGDIRIHSSVKVEDSWVEYVVRFTHGRVEWIRPLAEIRKESDLPPANLDLSLEPYVTAKAAEVAAEPVASGAGEGAEPSPEEALLGSLRRDRGELEKLLSECSDHWGYEDPVYRFYHQSFKVFWLQEATRAIVQRLQALAPDRPLNPWFLQIVEAGTGKTFQPEDNARWTEVTRPILEAFFHARFFLEMAVRYADLQEPPRMLPSGYAALLYLFGLVDRPLGNFDPESGTGPRKNSCLETRSALFPIDSPVLPSRGRVVPSGGSVAPSGGAALPSGGRVAPSLGGALPSGGAVLPSGFSHGPCAIPVMPSVSAVVPKRGEHRPKRGQTRRTRGQTAPSVGGEQNSRGADGRPFGDIA